MSKLLGEELEESRSKLSDQYYENMLMDAPNIFEGFYYDVVLSDIVLKGIADKSVIKRGTLDIPNEFTAVDISVDDIEPFKAAKKVKLGTLVHCPLFLNVLPNLTEVDGEFTVDVPDGTFSNCKFLATVNLPNLMAIGDMAFAGCDSLRKVDFSKCQYIGVSAFEACKGLKSVNLPKLTFLNNSNVYASRAFAQCTSLQEINIKSAVLLPEQCFEGCHSLIKLDLPCCMLMLTLCLNGCDNLTTLRLDSIHGFKQDSLLHCDSLRVLNYGGSEDDFAKNVKIEDQNELNVFSHVQINYNYKEK